jgi:hypothetical protein
MDDGPGRPLPEHGAKLHDLRVGRCCCVSRPSQRGFEKGGVQLVWRLYRRIRLVDTAA